MTGLPIRLSRPPELNALAIDRKLRMLAIDNILPALPMLQRTLMRYSHAMQVLASQSIACNRFHALPERTARWLLMMLDRVGGDEIDITQEFLAAMLGTHRPSTTLALATLEQAGLSNDAAWRLNLFPQERGNVYSPL